MKLIQRRRTVNGSVKPIAAFSNRRLAKVGAAGAVATAALLLSGCTSSTSATAAKDV